MTICVSFRVLVCESQPRCCCFSPVKSTLVFAGMVRLFLDVSKYVEDKNTLTWFLILCKISSVCVQTNTCSSSNMYSSKLSNLPPIAERRVFSGMGSERSFFTTSETYTVQSRMVAQISDIQYGFVLEYKKVLNFDNFM